MEEQRIKHLEFIQNTIGRMSSNSFLLKGWAITLVAALFALAAKDSNAVFAALAFFPALVFWGLDAYYLRRERLSRKPDSVQLAAVPSFTEWVAAGLPEIDSVQADLKRRIRANEPQTAPQIAAVEAYVAEVARWRDSAVQEIEALRRERFGPTSSI